MATRSLIPIGTPAEQAGVFAGRDLGVDRGGRGARHVGRRRAEGMDVRLELLHAAQHRFGHLDRGKLSCP